MFYQFFRSGPDELLSFLQGFLEVRACFHLLLIGCVCGAYLLAVFESEGTLFFPCTRPWDEYAVIEITHQVGQYKRGPEVFVVLFALEGAEEVTNLTACHILSCFRYFLMKPENVLELRSELLHSLMVARPGK